MAMLSFVIRVFNSLGTLALFLQAADKLLEAPAARRGMEKSFEELGIGDNDSVVFVDEIGAALPASVAEQLTPELRRQLATGMQLREELRQSGARP